MVSQRLFQIIYAPAVKSHVKKIGQEYYGLNREALETQLQFEPDVETKNRKPLKRPPVFGATWETRFGPDNRFCIFYRVVHASHEVHILAIGEKKRERLFIGGEEIEL